MKVGSSISVKGPGGRFLLQYLAMMSSTLSIICSGMHYGWPSPSLPKLLDDQEMNITITNEEGSWMAVMPLIGAVCGSLLGGTILDVIGRKNVILFANFPYIGSWLLVAYASSAIVLLVSRFVAGIADGLVFCAVPMYLGEIADPKIRGAIGSSVSVTWIFGILLINVLGSYLSIYMTALVSSAIPVLCLLTFFWMPESPYFYIIRGDEEKARKSLKIFKGSDDIEGELERLSVAVKEQCANTGKFFDLFTEKSNRKALYVMLGTRGFQQLCGTTAITFYAQNIFDKAGQIISPKVASIIYFGLQLTFCGICSMTVDKAGRRPLMIVSMSGTGLALLTLSIFFFLKEETNINIDDYSSLIPIITMIVFVIIFSVGMQTIPILLLGELYPANIKAFALSFADIYFSVVATSVSKFFQFTKDTYGMHVPFFTFTLCSVLGLTFIIFVVPETKGKTLEQIQDELRGKKRQTVIPVPRKYEEAKIV